MCALGLELCALGLELCTLGLGLCALGLELCALGLEMCAFCAYFNVHEVAERNKILGQNNNVGFAWFLLSGLWP